MTQCDAVINYMKQHKTISCWQAAKDLGIAALHSRISDLRRSGYEIGKEAEKFTDRHGVSRTGWIYWIISEPGVKT